LTKEMPKLKWWATQCSRTVPVMISAFRRNSSLCRKKIRGHKKLDSWLWPQWIILMQISLMITINLSEQAITLWWKLLRLRCSMENSNYHN
jgi:hypothetical protein